MNHCTMDLCLAYAYMIFLIEQIRDQFIWSTDSLFVIDIIVNEFIFGVGDRLLLLLVMLEQHRD